MDYVVTFKWCDDKPLQTKLMDLTQLNYAIIQGAIVVYMFQLS